MDQQHGNYKAYYRKRCFDTSERISCFDEHWFRGKKCIDIGCNEGAVTLLLAKMYEPNFIIGVDLDPRMIDAANAALKRAILEASKATAVVKNVQMMKSNPFLPRSLALTRTTNFPISCSQSGALHVAAAVKSEATTTDHAEFPRNISFVCKNVIDYISASAKYDVVSCLSVTKWIHLTEGDFGVLTLFRIIYQLTSPGGRAIIEYQPWSSYINNKKTSPTTLRNFATLQIKPEDFERILTTDIGFKLESRLGTPLAEAKGFKRPILVLYKDNNGCRKHEFDPHLWLSNSTAGDSSSAMDATTERSSESTPHQPDYSLNTMPICKGRKRYFGELDDQEVEEMLDEDDLIVTEPTRKKITC